MGSWFVRPDTTTLQLVEGQWVKVRKRLTSGEQRGAFDRMYDKTEDGKLKVNPLQTGLALIVAYLLDWSLVDDDGQKVEIIGLSADDLEQVVNNLAPDKFTLLKEAIEAHEAAMAREREAEKNAMDGGSSGPQTLPSPFAAAGTSNG